MASWVGEMGDELGRRREGWRWRAGSAKWVASWVGERGGELRRPRSPSLSPPLSFTPSPITQKERRNDIEEIEKEERGLRLLSLMKRKKRKRAREKNNILMEKREKS